jgi:hypothetical protein
MTVRINARIDGELARKVEFLEKVMDKSTTQVVRDSIEAYYQKVAAEVGAVTLLSDFIACAEGPPALSSTYKAELSRSLERKHR